MKLKEIIKVCDGPININFDGKAYGCIGHEFSSLYNDDAEYHKDYKANLEKVLKKYGNCEVINIDGFDDGLTITISGWEDK